MLTYAQIAPILAAMSDSTPLTLDELARQSGLEPRTIRSYVQADLVPRPSKRGRGATYEPTALDRLGAIKILRAERRMTLDDIRLLFEQCTDEQIRDLAQGAIGTSDASALPALAHGAVMSPRERMSRMPATVRDASDPGIDAMMAPDARQSPLEPRGSTELENLLNVLRHFTHSKRFSSTSSAETWTRVSITRDIELSVRGLRSEQDRYMLQQIADRIRVILKKGGVPTE
jgi:DNA-binding transcriptional MerR regulator